MSKSLGENRVVGSGKDGRTGGMSAVSQANEFSEECWPSLGGAGDPPVLEAAGLKSLSSASADVSCGERLERRRRTAPTPEFELFQSFWGGPESKSWGCRRTGGGRFRGRASFCGLVFLASEFRSPLALQPEPGPANVEILCSGRQGR